MPENKYKIVSPYVSYPGPNGAEVTAHSGDEVTDLPAKSLPWLLEQGHIVPVPVEDPGPVAPVEAPADSTESED